LVVYTLFAFKLLHTYVCLESGSRKAALRYWVAVASSVVDTCEPRSAAAAAAATALCDGDDVKDEVSDASAFCTSATISKSSSSADSAKRVKSNLRWTTVRPAQSTVT